MEDPLPPVEEAPDGCPMRLYQETISRGVTEYERPTVKEFARLASIQEGECYEWTEEGLRTKHPRLEELILFAQKCGYEKLGLAFCSGLRQEARAIVEILEGRGFQVASVCCKVGRVPKEAVGIKGEEKIFGPEMREPMCNPIVQAEVLNTEGVDLAVMLGLCIGHDTLFLKYCKAPVTVLAVKDRVFGHNPLGAVYLSRSPYYGRLRTKKEPVRKQAKVRP
jgi:uncharacterized metal-binding protein